MAALCQVAEQGEVAEGRALELTVIAQARGHGGLDQGRCWRGTS